MRSGSRVNPLISIVSIVGAVMTGRSSTTNLMDVKIEAAQLPTVYEYFTNGGIQTGLIADAPGFFKLNGRDIRIISGALHYFRVHPALWRDRLRKLRAAGLNTVETYVPWNLHEPRQGEFDFGEATIPQNEFSRFLDVRTFIKTAQEEDLLVLLRPGPYICSEWDLGGLPSWLLRDPAMAVRTSYEPYLRHVSLYFDELLPRITDLQFIHGGPIIGIQIENEYASFEPIDKPYLEHIKNIYDRHGFDTCLQFTSDGAYNGIKGSLPDKGVLLTANFQSNPKTNLDQLLKYQPNRPTMAMEFWSGWFDHWFENHHVIALKDFAEWLEGIFTHSHTSVNFYMFHGGTNFGFMAGANRVDKTPFYAPDVTSYDYNSPLSECGDYTDKYFKTMELIKKYEVPKLLHPQLPIENKKTKFPPVKMTSYLSFADILAQIPTYAIFESEELLTMEMLDMNSQSGQSYGYIVYQTNINFKKKSAKLTFEDPVRDFGIILLDGVIQGLTSEYWIGVNKTLTLNVDKRGIHQLTVVVENMGRINFGKASDFIQRKGLTGNVKFNSVPITNFMIYAAEFKSSWINELQEWKELPLESETTRVSSGIYRGTWNIDGQPEQDTFLLLSEWHKGIVFVNGFNLGRYWKVGPQRTLYLPYPILRSGENVIVVYEQLDAGQEVRFSDKPMLA